MADGKKGGGDSWLGNPNVLLALVTIGGGLWLVSQKLTSDRPVTPAGGASGFIGDQKLEARLWEDPFKRPAGNGASTRLGGDDRPFVQDLDSLVEQIERWIRAAAGEKAAVQNRGVLVLPVMISGGQYSEDEESRIRSRFAIVSALGRADYVPEDSEHIGVLELPWLTQKELHGAMRQASPAYERLWKTIPAPAPDADATRNPDGKRSNEAGAGSAPAPRIEQLGIEPSDRSSRMNMRYEWYRPRSFSAGSTIKQRWSGVLVLWLDDSYFEDEPLLRLSLLLEPLISPSNPSWPGTWAPEVALIGPRRSATLRSMLENWESKDEAWPRGINDSLKKLARAVLNRIDLYCATPSAMDEVLVKDPDKPDETPRESIKAKLKNTGFKSVHNFAATDAQMAREVLEELDLRGVDLGNSKNHVVLISEWDTFYARMLSLTYGAELALFHQGATQAWTPSNRANFISSFTAKADAKDVMPGNFHSLVYLRGLDGQTVGGSGGNGETRADRDRAGRSLPASVNELRFWAPDVNKAEGPAQFDYLGRLGDRVEELQQSLQRDNKGRIKAMGIVGSDVYDTLLILQALRDRFQDMLFFTTDLDVRFLHPRERDWARNLIVASSYGLALHPDLQDPVAPFRDSTQTAQFAAALAALGNTDLAGMEKIAPRRFEVGNRVAVDLSKSRQSPAGSQPEATFRLHPLTAIETHRARELWNFPRLGLSLAAAVLLLGGVSWSWRPLRRLTWDGWIYPGEVLDYTEEDIGGLDGAETLLRGLVGNPKHKLTEWLLQDSQLDKIRQDLEKLSGSTPDNSAWKREQLQASLAALFAARLNLLLPAARATSKRELSLQAATGAKPGLVAMLLSEADARVNRGVPLLRLWPAARRLIERHDTRRALDAFLDRVMGPSKAEEEMMPEPEAPREGAGVAIWLYLTTPSRQVDRFDGLLAGISSPVPPEDDKYKQIQTAALQTAMTARSSTQGMFRLRGRQLLCFWGSIVGFGLVGLGLAWSIWVDTFKLEGGEAFSLVSGTSAWPAQIVRLMVLALAVGLGFGLSHQRREAFLVLTRQFRFARPPKIDVVPAGQVCARAIWYEYRRDSRFRERWLPITVALAAYFTFLMLTFLASGEAVLHPVRGSVLVVWNWILLLASIFGFLFLALLSVDAACQCRDFIEKLSAGPTRYPDATRRHFSRLMGRIEEDYLDEWIDLQLIAELTERVGRLVYYPAGLLLLLILARFSWWDGWSWPVSLVIIFMFNFSLALASVVILQHAAKVAKRKAEESLTAKVKQLQEQAEPNPARNNAKQAEKLLEEVRSLDRGAFVPFWENPVVGAIFLSSGGTTMLQLAIWFMGR